MGRFSGVTEVSMLPVAQKIFSYSFLMLLATDKKFLGTDDGLVVVAMSSFTTLVVDEDMKGLEILPNNSVNPNNPFVTRSPPSWLFSLLLLESCKE